MSHSLPNRAWCRQMLVIFAMLALAGVVLVAAATALVAERVVGRTGDPPAAEPEL